MAPAFVTPAISTNSSTFLGCANVQSTIALNRGIQLRTARPRTNVRMISAGGEEGGSGSAEIPTAPTSSSENSVDEVLKGISEGTQTKMRGSAGGSEKYDMIGEDGEFSLETMSNDDLADVEVLEECAPPQSHLNKKLIVEAREKFKRHETDTGSPEYQIASLTTRITYLTNHLKQNPKDHASTRGLLKMVSTRTRLLKYLRRCDQDRFHNIIEGLNIRISQQLRLLGE